MNNNFYMFQPTWLHIINNWGCHLFHTGFSLLFYLFHTNSLSLCVLFFTSTRKEKQTVKWGALDLFLIYFMISYLTAMTQSFDTQNLWHCALILLIKKTCNFWSLLFLVFFKTANMKSCNFRNGVTWSYTLFKAHSSFSILYSTNSRTYELLEHQKLDKMIFQQPEHPICTRNNSYNS